MFISGASFLLLGCLACGANSETPAASLEEQASQAIGDTSETQPNEEDQLAADQGESLEAILPVVVTDLTGTEVTVDSIDRIIPLDGTVAEVVLSKFLIVSLILFGALNLMPSRSLASMYVDNAFTNSPSSNNSCASL